MSISVCLFGDSLGKGVVFDSVKQRYAIIKDNFVNLFCSGAKIPVVNYAKFGCTIAKGVSIVEKHAEELPKYDFVLLEFGGNDCDFDWAAVSQAPDAAHLPNTPLAEFETLYGRLIDAIRGKNGKPVLLSLPPLDAGRYFQWVSQNLNADNILRWLGGVERIYRWHEMYNMAVCRLAVSHKVPLIDIRSAFLMEKNYADLICEDGIHPNEKGHALISRSILQYCVPQPTPGLL